MLNLSNNQKPTTSIVKDDRNHILAPLTKSRTAKKKQEENLDGVTSNITPELRGILIHSLNNQLQVFSYKGYPLPEKQLYKRPTIYFRSCVNKRIIGALVTLKTLQKKCVTQSEVIDYFPHLKKSFVSKVFKHCVEEGWFIAHDTEVSKKIKCYHVADMIIQASLDFNENYSSFPHKLKFI